MQPAHTSIYSMLLTLLFYTTASVCALRAAAWLSVHALLPALSRVISHCYHHYRQRSTPEATRHAGISSSSSSPPLAGSGSGTLFKLVRTAAGHALFVPVSIAGPGAHDAQVADGLSGASDWTAPSMIPCPLLLRNAMLGFWLTSFLGTTILILLTYRYPNSYTYIQAVINSARRIRRRGGTTIPDHTTTSPSPSSLAQKASLDGDSGAAPAGAFETRTTKTRLNPAAPVFTPSLVRHRLLLDPGPTAGTRAFAFGPASPADSPGPATPLGPSRVRGAFTFALAARAPRRSKGGIGGSPLPFPLGVGKTRVVRPEDVIVGKQGADNVFASERF